MISIPLPQLYAADLTPIGRVHPSKLSLDLSLTPLSTACMELPPGEADVQVGMFFELFDLSGSAGFFRVCRVETCCGARPMLRLHLEHALCTLGDHVLFGYAEAGGAAMPTGAVITKLLEKQSFWVLGECDVCEYLAYSFENENLLTALLSLTAPLTAPVRWVCDFSSRPWRLSLKHLPTIPACECRMNRGAQSIRIGVDRSKLCTRLYPLGYGEGADQLTIADVNGGVKYLEADTAATWGVVESTLTEGSITDAATLKAAAQSVLDRLKNPVITVELRAADLSAMTGEPLDRLSLGELCRMPLPDLGVTMAERIIAIHRPNVYTAPEDARITLANRAAAATEELSALSRRSAIRDLYSQGASNQYEVPFADNADAEHPAVMRFYIDDDAIHVNAVKVCWTLERFRGYSQGASSGGGGTFTSIQHVVSQNVTTTSRTDDGFTDFTDAAVVSKHRHADQHQHAFRFDLTIPPLQVSLPNHKHSPVLGIYETAAPASRVSVRVDDTDVPTAVLAGGEFDAVGYLRKDSRGRIQRGAWHTITFTPDAPTRITAGVHVRTFIRSLTGANL